jgi:hypothetical protein
MLSSLASPSRARRVLISISVVSLLIAASIWMIFAFKQYMLLQQYQVYSAFVRETFPEWFRDSDFLIKVLPIACDSMSCVDSWLHHCSNSERLISLRRSHPGVSDDLLLRYYSSFLSRGVLLNRFSLPVRTVLLSAKELDCEKNENCMEEFFKNYPSAPGALRFSQVAFSADGQLAMFEYAYVFCPLCSHGGTVLMKKKWGRWHVLENFGGWTS